MVEVEQDRIRKLRNGAIDVALQNGVLFGRPKIQETEEFNEVYDFWKAEEMTAGKAKAMSELDIIKTTFYKLVKEYEKDFKKSILYIKETRQ
ncbi:MULTISPECIES: hypothetical protein [unclassified Peribacillus]|uniref:hypothetical protein n=1 Tax=unclassified Peribacillus TaxID=2675266 RepID=UPI001F5BDE22|nr:MULTISPECIES: hypothetical protein [unclassified Peribacillus]WMX53497.1 hypothetical protein RE409_15475 [Peribacillus sp. R9-11]